MAHGPRSKHVCRTRCRLRYVDGLRVTDDAALACVKEAAGSVRVEIEALLSMGIANSPMAGMRIPVASGNFVTARPSECSTASTTCTPAQCGVSTDALCANVSTMAPSP